MRVYSIGAYTIPFPCGLCLNIEHSLNSLALNSIFHIAYRLYLEAITERCVFFKTRETRHTEYNDRADQDVKLLVITCIQKNLSS